MEIRDAGKGDFDFILFGKTEVARMEGFEIPDMAHERRRVRKAIAEKRVRVAVDEGRPAGFIWFIESEEHPFGVDYGKFGMRYCWIDYVFVSEERRGKGIGTALYDDLARIARKRGVEKLMCDVFTVNKASADFHSRAGFEPLLTIYGRDCR